MAIGTNFKLKPSKQLGFRLNLVLIGVLSFYVMTTGYSLYTLWQQAKEFEALSNVYFDRAMHAAELSREAEIIASSALANMLNQEYGDKDNPPQDNLLLPKEKNTPIGQSFNTIRNMLIANTPKEQALLDKIDQLTSPYFNTVRILNSYLIKEQSMTNIKRQIEQSLLSLQKSAYNLTDNTSVEKSVSRDFIKAINLSILALHSTSEEQLQDKMNTISLFISDMAFQDNLTPRQWDSIGELTRQSKQAFTITLKQLRQHAATLTAVDQTRENAKLLSNASYDFYLLLKESTQAASKQHKIFISKVMMKIGLFSAVFLLLTVIAYWFIHHYLIRRLNRLNKVMLQHVDGIKADVPHSGNDEIALMGKAFSIFVEATNEAQKDSVEAQRKAEEANRKLTSLNHALQLLSHTDELTQMANRRHFFNELSGLWQQACEKDINMSLIMIDLDWFKSYNDFYGHQAGDKCLYQVAQLILSEVSNTQGMAARYGGEEFIILLPNYDVNQAIVFAETLQNKLSKAKIEHHHSPKKYITLSQGVTCHHPKQGDKVDHLIHLADQALYEAKNKGRNQISVLVQEWDSPFKVSLNRTNKI